MFQAGAALTKIAPDGPPSWAGVALGSVGMLAFSGTLPATRVATSAFGPTILTCSRIVIAAVLGAILLWFLRGWRLPECRHWAGIVLTGLGLAVGYPFFLALAMEWVPSAHGAVVVGLAPAVTAVFSVLRTGERPRFPFWLGCGAGTLAVLLFAIADGGGSVALADGWLAAAMLSVGLAYVEGGRVSRELGGSVTLCWAMIILSPFAAVLLLASARDLAFETISMGAWAGLWYASVISMFLGSIAWYHGLAIGGIARISQLNLAQPIFALLWSGLLLGERITWPFVATAVVVLVSMAVCVRSRYSPAPPGQDRARDG